MSADVERMEQYLRRAAVPEYVSEPHRQQLRRRLLGEIGKKRTIGVPVRSWKIAAAAVVLVGLGGIVGTFMGMRYDSANRGPGASYQLVSHDSTEIYPLSNADANEVLEAGPTARDLAEIELLRQQEALKLVRVIESEVDGRLESRTLVHRYILPDGQTRTIGETDLNGRKKPAVPVLTTAAWTEIDRLRQHGRGESLGTQEKEVKGRAFVFQRERYTLGNGTKVVLSVGEPKEAKPAPGAPAGEQP